MSGILGLWNLDGRPVSRALLADLSGTLAHRGADGDGLWVEGPVGLACRLRRVVPEAATETQPLVGPTGAVLVFDGRLDNREQLLDELHAAPGIGADSPDPALVLAAYDAFGERLPERLLGDFALGLFDPRRHALFLVRDAIGVRPLYYTRAGEAVLFASEVKTLLAHPEVPARPDDDVLAGFLLDRTPGAPGMTLFKGISAVLPAHVVTVTPEGLRAQRYWDFDPARRIRLGSFPEYAEAFREQLTRAVGRRLRSAHPVAVSVSGGLDSSSIFCLAQRLARRSPGRHAAVLGVSYVSPSGSPSDEVAFLREIERDYGVAIERIPIGSPGVVDGAREAVWHVEAPFLDSMWNTTHPFLATVGRLGARVLLTGHWGDQVLFEYAYLVDLFRALAWGEIRAHLRELGRWFGDAEARYYRRRFLVDLVKYHVPPALVPVLRRLRARREPPWYSAALRARARRRAGAAIPAPAAFHSVHARALYEEARSSHHVTCLEWNDKVAAMHGLDMAFPFLDRDLLAFLMAIPGDVQTSRGVPKGLLREGLRGVLPDAIRERAWKADFTHLVNDGVALDFERVRQCLETDGMAVRMGYLSAYALGEEFDRLRERVRGESCETAWDLSDLYGLELWLQLFFGGRDNGHPGVAGIEAEAKTATVGGSR